VQPGDSLFAIASRTGAGATAIADANNLAAPYPIRAGDRLQIPGGLYHKVGGGETGIAIARAYNVVWADVVMMNALQPPYTLQVGQNLLLPSAAMADATPAEMTPETRAAAFTLNIDDIVTGGQPAGVQTAASSGFTGSFGWPLRGNILARFGSQGGGRVNDGLNIAAAQGAPVLAAAPGTVVYSGNEIGVFGGLVLVDHGGGWVTAYGHLGSLNVAKGNRVSAGQRLGGVGETGYVSQPQLHFEIRKDRKPLDPLTRLGA
jgi:murein DD-endopeptidase MepM/ murein hydrolase activator NlpD